MANADPQTQGANQTSPPPPGARGPPATPAGNLDSSATTAKRPSRPVNVANAGTAAVVPGSNAHRNGAPSAEHDRRSRHREPREEHAVAEDYHAPPHVSTNVNVANAGTPAPVTSSHSHRNNAASAEHDRKAGRREPEDELVAAVINHAPPHVSATSPGVSHVYEQPSISPWLTHGRRDQQGPLSSQEIEWPDSPSDHSNSMLLDSDESDSATEDIEMSSDSDISCSGKSKGLQTQNAPGPRSTTTTYSGAVRSPSSARTPSHQGPSSSSHWMAESSWTPHSTFAPQSYSSARQKPSMCIVCGLKPPYSRNGKSYPTCGLTCAAALDDRKKREALESGRRSNYPGLCEVCNARPKHVNTSGRTYPTCGYRCAAKLDPAKSSTGVCIVCKKPSKSATGAGKYCSIACKDKAKAVVTVTCNICLACWIKPALPDHPACSDRCREAMRRWAPALIEMPRGHFMFDKYHKLFQAGRETTSTRKVVSVQHMYFFAQAPAVERRYMTYKAALERSLKGRSPAQTDGWVAITRECNVGDSGSVIICASPNCHFCNIMSNSFVQHDYPRGVPVALTAAKASEALRDVQRGPTKALLFVRVIHGPQSRLPERTETQLFGSQQARDDVVAVVQSWPKTRTELRVYNPDAIIPMGLLVYSEK